MRRFYPIEVVTIFFAVILKKIEEFLVEQLFIELSFFFRIRIPNCQYIIWIETMNGFIAHYGHIFKQMGNYRRLAFYIQIIFFLRNRSYTVEKDWVIVVAALYSRDF